MYVANLADSCTSTPLLLMPFSPVFDIMLESYLYYGFGLKTWLLEGSTNVILSLRQRVDRETDEFIEIILSNSQQGSRCWEGEQEQASVPVSR